MNTKSLMTILGATVFAAFAAFILMIAFASAQSGVLSQSADPQPEMKILSANDDLPLAGVSVTFPSGDWPWYAQGEISVFPAPPIPGQPAEICAEVQNHHPSEERHVILQFGIALLGIGLPYEPVGDIEVAVPASGFAGGCITWVPPHPGSWGIEALIFQDGMIEPERSLRNVDMSEPLQSNVPHGLVFQVKNPFDHSVTVTLGMVLHLPDWDLVLTPNVIHDLAGGDFHDVVLTVTPPMTLPPDGHPIVDVEGWVDGENIGGFRKIFRPPVPLHRFPDPVYAEGEISVHPYPLRIGEPTELCVVLYNPTDISQTVEIQFSWAPFGIGFPFNPINGLRAVTIPPFSLVRECIYWIPPVDGQACIQVELFMEEYDPQLSRLNLDVDEPLQPEVPHRLDFDVRNTHEDPVTITLELIPFLPGWGFELSQDVIPDIEAGSTQMVALTVTPPTDFPGDGHPIVDVEAHVNGELLGGFRKIFRPPIQLHRLPDPTYAESEITVHPYPPRAGEPTEVCVTLDNPTPNPHTVTLFFSWAPFGIGLPFQPINGPRVVHLPPDSVVVECIHWIPPLDGQVGFMVEMEMDGYQPQWSQLVLDVDEPLEPETPHSLIFEVGNPYDHPVTITLGLIPHLPGWEMSLFPDMLTNVLTESTGLVTLTVTPTFDLPPDEHPVVDVEAYVGGELLGGFRKIYRPPVPIHRPKDPIYAESEIYIHPYPPREQEPTLVGAEIFNPTDASKVVTITFSAAVFGIGLPFEIIHAPLVVEIPPGGMVSPEIMWIPPHGGLWCIQVDIELPGLSDVFYSQRNIDVGEPLQPLVPHARLFEVRNPYEHNVTITLGLIPYLSGWSIELSQDELPDMGVDEIRGVVLTVTPGVELPDDGYPIVDVEAFVDGELLGGFRKIYQPPVPLHRPKDPVYAESEIGVDPYPVLPGQPVQLSVEVFNPTENDAIVTATFSVAPFGIGLPFTTTHITPNPILIFVPAHGAARGHVIWQPPDWSGRFCVMVELAIEGHDSVWSRRNIDVGEPLEPGQPHTLVFEVGGWPYTHPVTATLGLINYMDGWDISLSDQVLYNLSPDIPVTVGLTVTPSHEAQLGTGEPIVDVEAFVDGELLGGFRKLDIPPVPLHKPHEKKYAESEIVIDPYPPKKGQETQVSIVVQNNSNVTQTVQLKFGWAKFGFGIPFTSTGMISATQAVTLGPYLTKTVSTGWMPTLSGHQCVIIELSESGDLYDPQESQRNVNVVENPPCGITKVFTFTVYNDSNFPVSVDLGLITFDVPPSWEVSTIPSTTLTLGPYGSGTVTVTVKIPCQPPPSGSLGAEPTIDVEGYIDGELVGGIEYQFTGIIGELIRIYLPMIMR